MKGYLNKVSIYLETKMNKQYRKIFMIAGMIWGMLCFFILDVPSQIIKNSIANVVISNKYSVQLGIGVSQSLIYGLGFFVFYTLIGAAIFIVAGELFIRFCEYFHINSKFYQHIVKIKDTTILSDIEFYDKYESGKTKEELKNE
jgi:hypothetical protein